MDTGKGSSVLIQKKDGNTFQLSSFSYYSPDNQKMLINVSSYYLMKSDPESFNISTYPSQNSDNVFAWDTKELSYNVCITNGKISPILDDKYNFESITNHESWHRYDENTLGGDIGEVNAILLQSTHSSWGKVTETYKKSQAAYAEKSLNLAISRGTINKKQLPNIIHELNNAFKGMDEFFINETSGQIERMVYSDY